MNEFNPQLDIEGLPKIEDLEFIALEKSYLKVILFYNTLFNLILLGAWIALYIIQPEEVDEQYLLPIGLLIVVRIIWSYVSRIIGFKKKSYALRSKDIVYNRGWLWSRTTIVPFNRVQHVSIDQGPLERNMNLSKLKIFTAGGNSSDLTIPGLRPEVSNQLKDYIVGQTSSSDEEE